MAQFKKEDFSWCSNKIIEENGKVKYECKKCHKIFYTDSFSNHTKNCITPEEKIQLQKDFIYSKNLNNIKVWNDEEVKNIPLIIRSNGRLNTKKLNTIIKNNQKLREYLEHRYKYFNNNYIDVITLILKEKEDWPKCKNCNKYLDKINNQYCSKTCQNKSPLKREKMEKTCINRYGVKVYSQTEEWKNKLEATLKEHYPDGDTGRFGTKSFKNKMKEKYGDECYSKTEDFSKKYKNIMNKKYNVDYYFQTDEFKEKYKKTCQERYQTDFYTQTDECKNKQKETLKQHYGVEFGLQNNDIINKKNKTCEEKFGTPYYSQTEEWIKSNYKRDKNHTFCSSVMEDKIYEKLIEIFSREDVIHQYTDKKRYPFHCDFYIKSLDLFIECNFYWTHMGHWFDKDNKDDIVKLNTLKEKIEKKHGSSYKVAIDIWTNRDLLKRKFAKNNNLNYVIFWKQKDIEEWVLKGKPLKFNN